MIRTGSKRPEVSRVMWASEQARTVWEPRVRAVNNYVMEMERRSCVKADRCAVQYLQLTELPERQKWAMENGLVLSVVEVKGTTARVIFSPARMYRRFYEAWRGNEQDAIGSMLGYPRCCVKFFKAAWVENDYMDTTWPMAVATSLPIDNEVHISRTTPWQANILMRWMGVRAVFHLPCSFSCWRTVGFADAMLDMEWEEYAWILEMLSWPMEWSALHGIARIKTPIFEISASTDHSETKYVVRREGIAYPKEGARGLVFPFRSDAEQEASLWEDNGFQSLAGMEAGHRVVLDAIPDEHEDFKTIWDLGCGNGLLLSKVGKKLNIDALIGVDLTEHHPRRFDGSFIKGNLVSASPSESDKPALALISENRLKEIPELAKILTGYSGYVVYSYEKMEANYTTHLGS